jgi:DNA-binding MarR family transcriptional regulator
VALSKHNLTTAELPFFAALQKYDGATQEELSVLVSVDKSATARTVKLLEEKGFARRVQDETDRRQIRVFLTDKARENWPNVEQELISFNELLTRNIAADSLETVYGALLQMEENAVQMSLNRNTTTKQE